MKFTLVLHESCTILKGVWSTLWRSIQVLLAPLLYSLTSVLRTHLILQRSILSLKPSAVSCNYSAECSQTLTIWSGRSQSHQYPIHSAQAIIQWTDKEWGTEGWSWWWSGSDFPFERVVRLYTTHHIRRYTYWLQMCEFSCTLKLRKEQRLPKVESFV